MTDYRDFQSLTADPAAGTTFARLADVQDELARPVAPRSAFSVAGVRAAVRRFVAANPEYSGPVALRF